MEQSIAGQQVMAEGPQASAEAAGMAGGQSAAQPAMGQQSQGGGCDCEETASNPQPQMAQPAGQAEGMGQPMASPGQQTVGMNPQMGVTMEQQPSALGAAAQAYGASPVTQNPGVMPDAGMNPQMAQPAGQAVNMGQPMAAPGQQTVGMNPQMSQPAAQAVGMGQQQAMYDPNQYAAWQAWYQQQAAQAANAAAMASQAAGPGGVAADGRAHHPKFEEHKYGQMIDMVGKFLNGEANVGEVVNGLFSLNFQDDQFWKGALVGAAAALLLTSETVQSSLTKTVGSIFATAQSGAEKVTKTFKEATEEVKKETKVK